MPILKYMRFVRVLIRVYDKRSRFFGVRLKASAARNESPKPRTPMVRARHPFRTNRCLADILQDLL